MGENKTIQHCNGLEIVFSKVYYGDFAVGGSLGYENKKVDVPGTRGWIPLSAHAPSRVVLKNTVPGEIMAAQNKDLPANVPHTAVVDGKELGAVRKQGEKTKSTRLEPGEHTLEFLDADDNGQAHTVWFYRSAPATSKSVPTESPSSTDTTAVPPSQLPSRVSSPAKEPISSGIPAETPTQASHSNQSAAAKPASRTSPAASGTGSAVFAAPGGIRTGRTTTNSGTGKAKNYQP